MGIPRLPPGSTLAFEAGLIRKVAGEGDPIFLYVGASFECRFNAFVDLRPTDIAYSKEILGLNAYFRSVVQEP
jgi:hypothetical protein